jgi:hypothetical protein
MVGTASRSCAAAATDGDTCWLSEMRQGASGGTPFKSTPAGAKPLTSLTAGPASLRALAVLRLLLAVLPGAAAAAAARAAAVVAASAAAVLSAVAAAAMLLVEPTGRRYTTSGCQAKA